MNIGAIVFVVFAVLVMLTIAKTATVVPQQNAFVVERLGRYLKTLTPGFHILIPFIDVIRYRHGLKERAVDIPEQVCITRDNVQVGVDGVLYIKVLVVPVKQHVTYRVSSGRVGLWQGCRKPLRSR